MHLAVNLRAFAKGRIGGMENYVRRIIAGLAERQRAAGERLTIFASEPEIVHVASDGAGRDWSSVVHRKTWSGPSRPFSRRRVRSAVLPAPGPGAAPAEDSVRGDHSRFAA